MQFFDNKQPNQLRPTVEAMVGGRTNELSLSIAEAEAAVDRVYPVPAHVNHEKEPPMAMPAAFEPATYEPLASEPAEAPVTPLQPANDLDLEAIRAQVAREAA